MTAIVFYLLAAAAVVSGLACILQRNPVAAAMWLVGAMFSLAGIYVVLDAQFIGVIQILVYAGAIMVLFLFVIMLLNLDREGSDVRRWPAFLIALAITTGLAAVLLTVGRYTPYRLAAEVTGSPAFSDPAAALPGGRAAAEAIAERGVVGAIAGPVFQRYLVPFELTSVLLLAAVVGAVVLAKRRL